MTTETPNRVQSYDKLLIGSKWIDPSTDSVIKVISDHRRALATIRRLAKPTSMPPSPQPVKPSMKVRGRG
jgi:hypothetical protein